MDFNLIWLLAAAAGGFFGAAIGALQAFVFTGLAIVISIAGVLGTGSPELATYVAFGPVFGPHIGFAGGVAAAAYAKKKGLLEGGKDIVTPLASLGRPDVLLVGALFGAGGYLVHLGVTHIPWFGSNTDSVAFTVVVSAIAARLIFGSFGITGRLPAGSGWARFKPTEESNWVRYQEKFSQHTVLGLFAGLLSAGITWWIITNLPAAAGSAHTLPFAISAISLLFMSTGMAVPVTHHMTLPAGLATATFLPLFEGNEGLAILIGALFGVLGAWLGEFFSRLMQAHGTTHIDPPAAAIWPATTIILALGAVVS